MPNLKVEKDCVKAVRKPMKTPYKRKIPADIAAKLNSQKLTPN